jgi:hypothetical protein
MIALAMDDVPPKQPTTQVIAEILYAVMSNVYLLPF